jgi:Ner family transcriptional regulator
MPEKDWDIFAIKAEVHRRGMTLVGIAEDAGLERRACINALRGVSRPGAQAIADALGIPLRTLFPTMYLRGHDRSQNLALKKKAATSTKMHTGADKDRGAA